VMTEWILQHVRWMCTAGLAQVVTLDRERRTQKGRALQVGLVAV
jgi:hypothetical protein